MNFEMAMADTQDAQSPEEFQEALRRYLQPGSISQERLLECLREMFPHDNVIEQDEAQRQRRAEASRKMQEAMSRLLEDGHRAQLERSKTPRVQLPRVLAYDTLLNLPHPEQDEEYERRYNILANGTPRQKAELLMEGMREARQGYTREKLMNLTDEEIAEDFEGLFRLQGYANAAVKLSRRTDLELSDEERKELLDFEKELSTPASTVFSRAKMIASPYYGLVHPERISIITGDRVNTDVDKIARTDEEKAALTDLKRDLENYQGIGMRVAWLTDITDRELEGFQCKDVTWRDQNGVTLQGPNGEGMAEPPVDQLLEGKPLTAVLPNGEVKVFSPDYRGGSNIALNSEPLSAYLDRGGHMATAGLSNQMDKQIPHALDSLDKSLKKVDHWYVKSSQAFKDVQADLEKMQKEWRALGPNPTDYQRERLRKQMQKLDEHCSAYIMDKSDKEKKTGLNDRDKERLAAMEAVKKFAQKQLTDLKILDTCAQARAAARENVAEQYAFRGVQSEEAREARQADIAGAGQNSLEAQAQRYENLKLPPSSAGNCIESLGKGIGMGMRALTAPDSGELSQASLSHLMAEMVLVDLVLKERNVTGFRQEGDPAGPIETRMNETTEKEVDNGLGTKNKVREATGYFALINQIKETPAFQKQMENLTPDSVKNFIVNRGGQSLSMNVLPELLAPRKSAQKAADPVNENSRQKAAENTNQKKPVSPVK